MFSQSEESVERPIQHSEPQNVEVNNIKGFDGDLRIYNEMQLLCRPDIYILGFGSLTDCSHVLYGLI